MNPQTANVIKHIVYAIFVPLFWLGYLYQQIVSAFIVGRQRSAYHLAVLNDPDLPNKIKAFEQQLADVQVLAGAEPASKLVN